jgi:hypothetical protein
MFGYNIIEKKGEIKYGWAFYPCNRGKFSIRNDLSCKKSGAITAEIDCERS